MSHLPSARHHAFLSALAPISEEEIDAALRTLMALHDVRLADVGERTRRDPNGHAAVLPHPDRRLDEAQRQASASPDAPPTS